MIRCPAGFNLHVAIDGHIRDGLAGIDIGPPSIGKSVGHTELRPIGDLHGISKAESIDCSPGFYRDIGRNRAFPDLHSCAGFDRDIVGSSAFFDIQGTVGFDRDIGRCLILGDGCSFISL